MSLEGLDLFAQKIQLRRTALRRSVQAGPFVATLLPDMPAFALLLDRLRTFPFNVALAT
jgi:hypothetical protein